eukprot:COSAG05_NODE_7348_length_824_cov_0.920000_1_plen_35_part_10
MTHNGGYIVLWNNNIFHRRARQRFQGQASGIGDEP